MLEATTHIIYMCELMDSRGVRMSGDDCESLLQAYKRFCAATQDMEALRTPKRHSVAHMVCLTPHKGSPRYYSKWFDEGLNRVLKRACSHLLQATFEDTVLLEMPNNIKMPAPTEQNAIKRKLNYFTTYCFPNSLLQGGKG